jgi:peroxiredoxin (alkyl hydroperoxide reductase subunit C)
MLHPGESSTVTVRAVFVIDPNAKIRAIIYYPLSAGRNMKEILRLVDALQTADKYQVATPADWVPEPQT